MADETRDDDNRISLTLNETLREFVNAQVVGGGYNDASAYLYHLVREEQKRVVRNRVMALLSAGSSSSLRERTDADWELLRAEVTGLSGVARGREVL